ncbi:hypothetical protein [Amycolatopsis taiwanensis]|uniref:hypothetical protein n=1 Tax=Amycolatopsis taiwanensis TaxID=342230 RepID=UPI0004B74858|nr:hypothetical protein [Amycolatopsis taiwanensis]
MPRIRTIKPSFFRSEDVSALPLRARLTWIGLWTHCDDAGRTKDNVRLIKGDIWPLDDVSLADIEEDLETLAAHGRIVRYEVDGRRYLEIVNWDDHQSIQKPTPSKIPPASNGALVPPPEPDGSATGGLPEKTAGYPQIPGSGSPVGLRDSSGSPTSGKGKEGKGKEGKGTRARGSISDDRPSTREPPPPPNPQPQRPLDRCIDHEHDPDPPPCGACARAREARERWDADAAEQAQVRRAEAVHQRAETRAHAIAACDMCDQTGYVGAALCHHDPTAADRARRGMALVRAALGKDHGSTDPPDDDRQAS